jgi:hypothetical protein
MNSNQIELKRKGFVFCFFFGKEYVWMKLSFAVDKSCESCKKFN